MSEVLALGYHAASAGWPWELSVGGATIRDHVVRLLEQGYRPMTFSDAISGAETSSGRVICITFDDAFCSVHREAFPALRELGVPATLFVPTRFVTLGAPLSWPGIDHLDGDPEWSGELQPMSWHEIREVAEDGWEIGSHTVSHPWLPGLDEDTLRVELKESRETIEAEIGRPCTSLAYPYGGHDDRVVDAARAAGYGFACTLPNRLTRGAPLTWPRIGIFRQDRGWRFRLKVAPQMRALRSSGAWDTLTSGRRLFRGSSTAATSHRAK
jgi:peptidoglycan/xylan/chitin deacetylase (PgdA/CDA1 family)